MKRIEAVLAQRRRIEMAKALTALLLWALLLGML